MAADPEVLVREHLAPCAHALLLAAPTAGIASLLALCDRRGAALFISTLLRSDNLSLQ